MENYVIPIPADFSGQLYIRRAIVNKLEFEINSQIPKEVTHLIPQLGALHLALNTRESVGLIFHSFFDQMNKAVFKKKQKLAAKPKPWKLNLILYLAQGGWMLVKKYIIARFSNSKDMGYLTFLDLLDNLVPSTLDIYSYLFQENHFEEYVNTVFRLWTVMRRF